MKAPVCWFLVVRLSSGKANTIVCIHSVTCWKELSRLPDVCGTLPALFGRHLSWRASLPVLPAWRPATTGEQPPQNALRETDVQGCMRGPSKSKVKDLRAGSILHRHTFSSLAVHEAGAPMEALPWPSFCPTQMNWQSRKRKAHFDLDLGKEAAVRAGTGNLLFTFLPLLAHTQLGV